MLRCDVNGNSIARQLLNDIFGEEMFESELLVQRIRKNVTKQGRISLPLANDSLFLYMNSEDSILVNPFKRLASKREEYWRRMDDSSGFRNPPQRNIFGLIFEPYKREAHFKFSQDTIGKMIKDGRIRLLCKDCKYEHYEGDIKYCPHCGGNNFTPQYKVQESEEIVLDTNWLDIPGYSSNWRFSTENSLPLLERCIKLGSYPDSTILDFFGGCGTTGHAVISLNRIDQGNRKFILVDMGEQFNNDLLPRIKKVTYSSEWANTKIKKRCKSLNYITKYFSLESYEDALNNIQLKKQEGLASLFGDDYTINYMLDLEAKGSLLNLEAFKTPFSYEMNITEKNEMKPRRVDVCETFNYLIGLRVKRQSVISSYDCIPAEKPEYEGAVDLVKGSQFAFRQIEGTLPDGRKALVVWRTISDDLRTSNAALDAYFEKYRSNPLDRDFDVIYVNGDNNLENLRNSGESWKVVLTEQEFNKRMFEDM